MRDFEAGCQQLEAIAERFRELLHEYPWLIERIKRAHIGFEKLNQQHTEAVHRNNSLREGAMLKVLEQGRVRDVELDNENYCECDLACGKWPESLDIRYKAHDHMTELPPELERDVASAITYSVKYLRDFNNADISSAERELLRQSYLRRLHSEPHVEFRVHIYFPMPKSVVEPINPHSFSRTDLEQWSDEEYLDIALYRLTRLADVGQHRPLIPKPKDVEGFVESIGAYSSWHLDAPIHSSEFGEENPQLNPFHYRPDALQQMLDFLVLHLKTRTPDGGHNRSVFDPTMSDLTSAAGISDETFRRIRGEAGIKFDLKGRAASNYRYSRDEVDSLIAALLRGEFLKKEHIENAWAQWGSRMQ